MPSLSPVKVPGLCFSVYSECDWLQCILSECFWLVSSLLARCYWLLESVPAAVEDGLLRLYKAENSVLPPIGDELCTDHPLLGRRRECKNENWHMQVYPLLQRNKDDLAYARKRESHQIHCRCYKDH